MFYIVWKYFTRLSENREYRVMQGDIDHIISEGWNFVCGHDFTPMKFDNQYDADTELYSMPLPFLSFDENEALEVQIEMDLEMHKEFEMLRKIRAYRQSEGDRRI